MLGVVLEVETLLVAVVPGSVGEADGGFGGGEPELVGVGEREGEGLKEEEREQEEQKILHYLIID